MNRTSFFTFLTLLCLAATPAWAHSADGLIVAFIIVPCILVAVAAVAIVLAAGMFRKVKTAPQTESPVWSLAKVIVFVVLTVILRLIAWWGHMAIVGPGTTLLVKALFFMPIVMIDIATLRLAFLVLKQKRLIEAMLLVAPVILEAALFYAGRI